MLPGAEVSHIGGAQKRFVNVPHFFILELDFRILLKSVSKRVLFTETNEPLTLIWRSYVCLQLYGRSLS